ncbi:N-acetylmuramoyl-L-alanine amidase [Sphingopyxis sp. PET50]|uniref:N-acetylmuramoyl-L-alanine amidase family protein n=1 Tax=Sphingopyxis sp. PET50 TaxID=2976533 RepID=UPI0039195AFA
MLDLDQLGARVERTLRRRRAQPVVPAPAGLRRRIPARLARPPSPASAAAAQFRAKPPEKRYSVTVPIGKPKPAVALPKIEGPANPRLPLVVIDAGHGGHDPGAINPHSGKREKDITLGIARAIRDDLIASGRVRVALTRSDDRYLVLEERYGIARRLKADLFISIHADAAENQQASGASIYTLSEVASDREAARLAARENKANIINGVDLGAHSSDVSSILLDLTQRETMNVASDFARLLQREASDDVKFRSTAHRFASFVVLKAPDTPSVLFETGFISNEGDADFLASAAGQKRSRAGSATRCRSTSRARSRRTDLLRHCFASLAMTMKFGVDHCLPYRQLPYERRGERHGLEQLVGQRRRARCRHPPAKRGRTREPDPQRDESPRDRRSTTASCRSANRTSSSSASTRFPAGSPSPPTARPRASPPAGASSG